MPQVKPEVSRRMDNSSADGPITRQLTSSKDGGRGVAKSSLALADSLDETTASGRLYDKNLFLDCQFVNHHLNWVLETSEKNPTDPEYDYVLLRGIANDSSFEINGSHEFGDGDSFGTTQLIKTVANGINEFIEPGAVAYNLVDTITKKIPGLEKGIQGGIDWLADAIGGKTGNWLRQGGVKQVLGGHFVTAFDHIKVFKGTNLEINFPPLTTRIYHGQWRGWSVLKVLDSLTERFVGNLYNPLAEDSSLASLFGIQQAPNGYQPQFNSVAWDPTKKMPGTFKLTYCGYEIKNLLVTNFSFKLSTMRVRTRKDSGDWTGDPSELLSSSSPLYIDVSITVQPCTYISKQVISDIMASKYLEDTTQSHLSEV